MIFQDGNLKTLNLILNFQFQSDKRMNQNVIVELVLIKLIKHTKKLTNICVRNDISNFLSELTFSFFGFPC